MCTYLKAETDVAQNMIDYFFLTLTVRRPFHRKNFKWGVYGSTGLRSEETEGLHRAQQKSGSSYQHLSCNNIFFTIYLFGACG